MRPIQVILLLLIFGLMVFYLRNFRANAFDALIVGTLLVSGSFLVLNPKSANIIANLVGVGRGADLITYIAFFIFSFLIVNLYISYRTLKRQLTDLAREIALEQATRSVEGED